MWFLAEVHDLLWGKGVALTLLGSELHQQVVFGDIEANRAELIGVVAAVEAKMIVLPVVLFAQLGRIDGWIFERFRVAVVYRNLEDAPSAGLHHPKKLAHGLPIVGDVLQDVVAHDDIKRIVGEGDVLNVHLHIGPGRDEVAGDVLDMLQPPK